MTTPKRGVSTSSLFPRRRPSTLGNKKTDTNNNNDNDNSNTLTTSSWSNETIFATGESFLTYVNSKFDAKTIDAFFKDAKDFSFGQKIIGEGAFSNVKEGIFEGTNQRLAIKFISPFEHPEKLFKEIQAMIILQNAPHMPSFFGYFSFNDYICLSMELLDGWVLRDKILGSRNGLEDFRVAKYMSQVAEALQYCHENGILHRDLKSENVIITRKEDNAKLLDLGLCELFDKRKPCPKFKDNVGTVEYIPPEILLGKGHSKEMDYWGLGILTFESLTKRTPYRGELDGCKEIIQRIKSNKMAYNLGLIHDEGARKCVAGLLEYEPSRRMNFKTFIQHRWIFLMYMKAVQMFSKRS